MLGLAFSGGKDSLACWYLYRKQNPIVFWVNTGKTYPETLQIIDEIKAQTRQFVEVKSDVENSFRVSGLPSDIVPANHTELGMQITGPNDIKVRSYIECCHDNKAMPLINACMQHGVTKLVRGQRKDDTHKSASKNGDVVFGIKFIHPIEEWTKDQVLQFIIANRGELPDHYKINHTSLDCYTCTAFMNESQDRIAWTKEKHPELHKEYIVQFEKLASTIRPSLKYFGVQ
jgi:phosphoadenosine phosphosulfate reductase